MTMRCGRARRLLWPDDGPRVMSPEIEEAQAHREVCESCRRFLTDMPIIADQVRILAPRPEAPPAVRERLFTVLARERAHLPPPRRPWRRTRRAVMIVAAVLVAGATLWATQQDTADSAWRTPVAAIAEDHVRALHEQSITTSDADAVRRWLAIRVPFAIDVPVIPDATLEGARLCLLNGRRGAVLRYRVDGQPVSYYIMPSGSDGRAAPDPAAFRHDAEAGYRVVTWRDQGLVHALVGDLPQERLSTMARVCAHRTEVGLRIDEGPLLAHIPRMNRP
jgi:hypothetical protein